MAGSGPGGRILESDVQAAAGGQGVAAGAPPAVRPSPVAAGTRLEPLSPIRRAIGERLRAGLASTAQLTLTGEADVTDARRAAGPPDPAAGRRASYTEVVVRACALALRDHPRLAASWTPDGLIHSDRIDVGVAVTLDEGLIVPVVRDADRKTVETLGREIADLAERARTGRLEAPETEGACFNVTNLGGYRVDAFTPLLNPPQAAILGVGRARPRPAVVDGSVVARTLVVLSLTFDHQVVDGAPAAAFLETVVELLEDAGSPVGRILAPRAARPGAPDRVATRIGYAVRIRRRSPSIRRRRASSRDRGHGGHAHEQQHGDHVEDAAQVPGPRQAQHVPADDPDQEARVQQGEVSVERRRVGERRANTRGRSPGRGRTPSRPRTPGTGRGGARRRPRLPSMSR